MGKRPTDREKLLFKLDLLSDNEVHEILEYISIMESMRCDRSEREILEDELLTLLASARENRRAQQVYEWEAVRRQTETAQHHDRS
jgi:hypothetical protein